ncbi:DUF4398 domain-containing protein [Dyella silvatica]|uniref:DUF4398 domain-containing protein n=1 Tax=Dyella silvatica TaxID=2992128 RepID=UPI00224D1E1F|nr:DUF4398 domain-containing protein [Dyella silvatica]
MIHIFSPLKKRANRVRSTVSTLALASMLAMLSGCASVPPPDGAMNQAQLQLRAARDAGAADYAPVDLGMAQNRFQLAQAAMANRKYEDAANLADEARADAELARAKARLGAARAQVQAKSEDNSRLRDQLDRAHSNDDNQSSVPGTPGRQPVQTQDMPAPAASDLSAPMQQGQGFQTLPDPSQQNSDQQQPTRQGGQP